MDKISLLAQVGTYALIRHIDHDGDKVFQIVDLSIIGTHAAAIFYTTDSTRAWNEWTRRLQTLAAMDQLNRDCRKRQQNDDKPAIYTVIEYPLGGWGDTVTHETRQAAHDYAVERTERDDYPLVHLYTAHGMYTDTYQRGKRK